MKKILFFSLFILGLISCSNSPRSEYSLDEVTTLISIDSAEVLNDSIDVISDYGASPRRLPIIKIGNYGYYPTYSGMSGTYYKRVDF